MLPSLITVSLLGLGSLQGALAATAEQWRTRSIYQIITDRYSLEPGAVVNECVVSQATWCGGTWKGIMNKLDYIQNAGFTAIWISPVNQNYGGPRTAYGDPYHGYWPADISQLNDKMGTSDDLKALSAELHRRDMYLMVDVVINNVMATSITPDLSTYLFKDAAHYHPYCGINWSNLTSEQQCWLGDTVVPLPDINTENADVVSRYQSWIANLVQTYSIDGLRIDAAKHIRKDFWPAFVKSAGVFAMGEIDDVDVPSVSMYQGTDALPSVLNYPTYHALVSAFALPGPQNMSALVDILNQSNAQYTDTTVLGNFLENQDNPRWGNLSVDPQSLYNAMTYTFLSDGIPIVYYGQEQGFHGNSDPYNREPLWPSNYTNTTALQLITSLNQMRNYLVNTSDWATQKMNVLASDSNGIAFQKGHAVVILTNIGSPSQNLTNIAFKSPWPPGTVAIDIVACRQFVAASQGYIGVEYTKGGVPVVLGTADVVKKTGLCQNALAALHDNSFGGSVVAQSSSPSQFRPSLAASLVSLLLLTFFGLGHSVA